MKEKQRLDANLRKRIARLEGKKNQILNPLPVIAKPKTSGSDIEDEIDHTKCDFALIDDAGMNEVARVFSLHAMCGCGGELRHSMNNTFLKPTMVVYCPTHGKTCTLGGKSRAINLTQCIDLSSRN